MFDFAELFTKAARQVVPVVLDRKLAFAFDCSSATVTVPRDAEAFRGAIHRLFTGIVDVARSGFVSFRAVSRISATGAVEISIQAGCVGSMASPPEIDALAARLDLRSRLATDALTMATGHWSAIDADVELHVSPGEGALLSMRLILDDASLAEQAPVSAHEARAWLVNAEPTLAQAWSRRFQRLGWAISLFASYADAIRQLGEQPRSARPSIVVVVESGDPQTDGTKSLPLALPHWTRLIYAVPAGSPSLRDVGSPDGYTVRVLPFSPSDLREFTEQLDESGLVSGATIPAPLTLRETPRILIVDDSPVNLVVGRGLVESMGYAVDTADGALEAISRCMSGAPDAVLMDIEMPELNGIEVTNRLRELQSRGELPPFPIVALTASWSPALQENCLAAGMEDCLPKPIRVEELARCIRRVVTLR